MSFFNLVRSIKVSLVIIFSLLFTIFPDAIAKSHLTVLVPNFPPYTLEKNTKVSGIGIDLANKVFKKAGISVRYRILPNYAKALHELEQGRGDAVLLVSQNEERDTVAVFTKPLMVNRWCWYLLKGAKLIPHDTNFKSSAKVSSYFKSNTHKWLIKNNYTVEPVMKVGKLPQMLMRARVDAVFIAELVFEEAMKQDNLELSQFKKYIEIEKPFGIYISKAYLARYPENLNIINQAIANSFMNSL
ncbi:MAG: transporter substrate-binding domain-containing protein [Colwellia sp.]|nr:transporter substrate-binding domain-containing protein [Colwellia sp.]